MTDAINIRASSIASIIDCPLRGLSIALGYVKSLPSTAPACIGTACHEGTAAFDKAKLDGCPISADDAAGVMVDLIWHPEQEVYWGRTTQKEAERRALGVLTRYCSDIAPTIEYKDIELSLAPMVVEVEGIEIELTGTLDRIYNEFEPNIIVTNEAEIHETPTGRSGILDIKTGARVCSTKPGKHKGQIAVYEILAEHTTGQSMTAPGLIGQLQTSSEYQVDVKPVANAREALVGNDEHIGLLHHIARMLKSGDFYGNSSSWLCSDKYCALYNDCIFK